MPKGKMYDTNCGHGPGKAKADGGSSFGKKSKLNKANRVTPHPKQVGTPKDKGVNR